MSRLSRINKHGVFQIKRSHRWVKPKGSTVNPGKTKRWAEGKKQKRMDKE